MSELAAEYGPLRSVRTSGRIGPGTHIRVHTGRDVDDTERHILVIGIGAGGADLYADLADLARLRDVLAAAVDGPETGDPR